jgi:hypothetical protein
MDRETKHLQAFLPMTISIKKGGDDHRQKTDHKSGEQTSPYFSYPNFRFSQSERRRQLSPSSSKPGCFADVLWLKAKVDGRLFHEEKEQTQVWNPLLLLLGVDDCG